MVSAEPNHPRPSGRRRLSAASGQLRVRPPRRRTRGPPNGLKVVAGVTQTSVEASADTVPPSIWRCRPLAAVRDVARTRPLAAHCRRAPTYPSLRWSFPEADVDERCCIFTQFNGRSAGRSDRPVLASFQACHFWIDARSGNAAAVRTSAAARRGKMPPSSTRRGSHRVRQ